MNGEVLAKVFYTPVQDPENVRCIEITKDDELRIVNDFVKRIVSKKIKKPSTTEPKFREEILTEFMEGRLEITLEQVRTLLRRLSEYMYGRAREKIKYWCLIYTNEYLFIYHFAPTKSVSFEGNSIREFVKYLDDTSMLKFIFKLKSDCVSSYFEQLPEEEKQRIKNETTHVYGIYDKNSTKGMKKLTGEEPEYEFKGELRVRIKRSDKTDIVVETFLADLENINSNIIFDFERGIATINIEDAPIKELVLDGSKYDVKTGLKRIEYEKLGIGEFMEKYRFYKNDEEITEFIDYVVVIKEIEKPETSLKGKEKTIFILGDNVKEHENLIKDSSEEIKNNFNVGFVELSGFSADYDKVDIGHFTIFAKLKNDEKLENVKETFNRIISSVKGNLTLEKTLHYVGLLVLCNFLRSEGFKEKLYEIGKKALYDYYKNMPERNIELKEIDKLGIEFKAGIRKEIINGKIKEEGFFDPSPERFANKLLQKLKRKDSVIFFIGINEDTRDFSPIPLSQIRNEFHESLREHLSQNGVNVLLSETVPISNKEGILILFLQKGRINDENS